MANDLNRVVQIGRLTKDPIVKVSKSGITISNFDMAINSKFKGEDQVSFFNYVAYGKTAEVINEYCKKGHRIAIEGSLQQRRWEDADGKKRSMIEIKVDIVQFLQSATNSPIYEEIDTLDQGFAKSLLNDDDIPF